MIDSQDDGVAAMVDLQIQNQGVSCVKAKDGHVFTFTTSVLEYLLKAAKAHPTGRAILFVKTGPTA